MSLAASVDHRILSANNRTGRSLYAIFDGVFADHCDARSLSGTGSQPSGTGVPAARYRRGLPSGDHPRASPSGSYAALQQTTEWKDRYKIRAGIEATNSELKRAHGIGRLRVRRLVKVCFAVACKVIACNIKRWAKALIGLEGSYMAAPVPFTLFQSSRGPILMACFVSRRVTCSWSE